MDSILNMILSIGLGIYYFGKHFMVLVASIAVVGYINSLIFKVWFKYEDKWAIATDKRLQSVKNMLNNIKFIKMNAFENIFFKKVSESRAIETGYILICCFAASMFRFCLPMGNTVSIVTFMYFYFKNDGHLDVSVSTVLLRIFSLLNDAMIGLPAAITGFGDLMIGARRITGFLRSKELEIGRVKQKIDEDYEYAIEIEEGTFYWDKKISKEDSKKLKEEQKKMEKLQKKRAKKQKKRDKKLAKQLKKNRTGQSTTSLTTTTQGSLRQTLLSQVTLDEKGLIPTKVETEKKFRFEGINFKAKKGSLTMVIGKIGSGKSSLLYSILGEMRIGDFSRTKVSVNSSLAYCGQTPWLMNGTVEENILLNKDFNQEQFDFAVKYSALDIDIKNWTLGSKHIIGDDGSSISGGQRTRIALARCLYQDPETYIFDDVMSALDAKVGSFITEKTILKQLRNKTVVLITHGLQYLKYSDYIYVMDEGEMLLEGTFTDVQKSELYQKFLELDEWSKDVNESNNSKTDVIETDQKSENKTEKIEQNTTEKEIKNENSTEQILDSDDKILIALNKPEEQQKGKITAETYREFISALGGWWVVGLTILVAISSAVIMMYSSKYLEDWSHNFDHGDKYAKLKQYAMICLIGSFLQAMINIITGIVGYNLSVRIHSKMVFGVLHSQMERFLDRIPIGRIVNRFSADIDTVDKRVYSYFAYMIRVNAQALILFVTICYSVGWEVLGLIFIWLLLAFYCQNLFLNARREYKRVCSVAKSPMINSFTDTLKGLPILRNTGQNLLPWIRAKFMKQIALITNLNVLDNILVNWFDLRLGLYQELIIQMGSFLLLVFYYDNLSAANFGLFTLCVFQMGFTLRDSIKVRTEVVVSMIAIERCSYLNKLKPEPNYKTLDFEKKKFIKGGKKRMQKLLEYEKTVQREQLVSNGELKFENVSARYLSSDRNVLSKLNFTVNPGEKVGVVGRTGSGKSSLIKLIWRYLYPSEGRILVDGKDISEVDLKALRSQIVVISQETALYEGTLRENLDPSGFMYTKEQLKDILRKLGFQHKSYEKDGLEMEIDTNGGNLSKGEQQLVCFARCALRNAKLIILDEATASIDIKTEEMIQKCVDEDFNDSSMLIIAHRVQTVMDCDRIIVLKDGLIDDYDTPSNLMKKGGFFKDIVDHMQSQ